MVRRAVVGNQQLKIDVSLLQDRFDGLGQKLRIVENVDANTNHERNSPGSICNWLTWIHRHYIPNNAEKGQQADGEKGHIQFPPAMPMRGRARVSVVIIVPALVGLLSNGEGWHNN